MTWLLNKPELENQTVEIGGPEFLTIEEVVEQVMSAASIQRMVVKMRPSTLRLVAIVLENLYPTFPHSVYWLDYLANDRSCDIDSLTRYFGLLPARFGSQLNYLSGQPWSRMARRSLRRK